MKRVAALLVLCAGACGDENDRVAQQPPAHGPVLAAPAAPQMGAGGNSAATKMAMIEVPADKQQLDRLLAMGYSVHEDHMHPPGTKECPYDMGGSVVQ